MSSVAARLQRIDDLLTPLKQIQSYVASGRNEKLFELECYLRTMESLCTLNREAIPQLRGGTQFRPLYNPGSIGSGSYFTLRNRSAGGAKMDLYMNCSIRGQSDVFHSPDIILTWRLDNEIFSIYECKMYSSELGLSVYREFIGYLMEMGLRKSQWRAKIRRFAPDASPRIYTTAFAPPQHRPIAEAYEFDIEDNLP